MNQPFSLVTISNLVRTYVCTFTVVCLCVIMGGSGVPAILMYDSCCNGVAPSSGIRQSGM